MNYDVDHFIRKFEAIPEENWCMEAFKRSDGRRCAVGHCGVKEADWQTEFSEEAQALIDLFAHAKRAVTYVNDGVDIDYPQPTPRARILAALRDVKMNQNQPNQLSGISR